MQPRPRLPLPSLFTLLALALPSASPLHVFTCRHTYESTLAEELANAGVPAAAVTTVCPAVVSVSGELPALDPTYALQWLPCAAEVQGASVRLLADAAVAACGDALLGEAPRGALAVHALVPDLLKGGRTPRLLRRCEAIADRALERLRVRHRSARPLAAGEALPGDAPRLLLQLLLLSPERLLVSLSPCEQGRGLGTWPNWHAPAGLASVDVPKSTHMPSSAYRKLSEAFDCLQQWPAPADRVVDLGACPGGWTATLRRLGCSVIAVDRSPLDAQLAHDPRVTFVGGDAFAYEPPWAGEEGRGVRTWMVSDVIAYPARAVELVRRWGSRRWASRMVVTMKFQARVDWAALDEAGSVAESLGYDFRSKHFFNNKNEVTLLLQLRE